MTRWHRPSCNKPNVVLAKDSTPHCATCGVSSRDTIDKLRAQQNTTSTLRPIPPDEPHGALNLWWPPVVSYTRDGPLAAHVPDSSKPGESTAATKLEETNYHVYSGGRLAKNEMRLLCLSSEKCLDNHPVHISLDTYQFDDCPEYETVSYTWGGENNDSEL